MSHQSPSIQSFFPPQPTVTDPTRSVPSPGQIGDGFSGEELTHPVTPKRGQWKPRQVYADYEIGNLVVGPRKVCITGRIVNMYEQQQQQQTGKKPQAAKGQLRLIIKDDTGALMLKLYYADETYDLRLGQLCKVWTPHISKSDEASITPSLRLFTSIFPERERSCFFSKLEDDDNDNNTRHRAPLGYQPGVPLPYLMTLKEYLDGGHEIDDCKILICIKSIGPRKKYTNNTGGSFLRVHIGVFDNTAETTFTLWGAASASVIEWKPSSTVLLISGPRWNARNASIGVSRATMVDVDPCMPEVDWLRRFAGTLTRRDSVVQPFPYDVLDVNAPLEAGNKLLFTFAELDGFARTNPREKCTGFLSVLIVEMNLISLRRDHRLLCAECCGVPLYANSMSATCKNCDAEVRLELNPRIVGNMIDETGGLQGAKCIWSSLAFEQLLGRGAQELVECDADVVRDLQHNILYLRFTLAIAWAEEVGKLAICQVLQ